MMLEARPDLYFQTPHYEGYPGVLVHLDAIDLDELRERIEDAWLIQAPKRLAKDYLAGKSPSLVGLKQRLARIRRVGLLRQWRLRLDARSVPRRNLVDGVDDLVVSGSRPDGDDHARPVA